VRNTKVPRRITVVAVLAAIVLAPLSQAQRLNGVWFKLDLSAHGHTLDNSGNTDTFVKSQTVYVSFTSTDTPCEYDLHFWTRRDNAWTNSFGAYMTTLQGKNENIMSSMDVQFHGNGEDYLDTTFTAYIDSQLNSSGGVASATFDGQGIIFDGKISGAQPYGSLTLTGKKINPSDLPFTPPVEE